MYPFVRFAIETARARRQPALPIDGTHVSHHTCLPGDLDPWSELNNGRTLTLYDLGRVPLVIRLGLIRALETQGWGLAIAGASVRYRRRVRVFHRLEMRSRVLGRDPRFFYIHQAMFRRGEAVSAALFRTAVTEPAGIVATDRAVASLGLPDWRPALPAWVTAWAEAEAARPWPPEV